MNPMRSGTYDLPSSHPYSSTRVLLRFLLAEALREIMPGTTEEVRDLASRLLMRNATLASLRRERERTPANSNWRIELLEAGTRKLRNAVERELVRQGVTHETLERVKGLYPLAEDIRRDEQFSWELQERHGCKKCRHCYSSWEHSGSGTVPDGARGPFCDVYGDVPAFCFDFKPTRFCSGCGKRMSPIRVAEAGPVPVECKTCKRRHRAAGASTSRRPCS